MGRAKASQGVRKPSQERSRETVAAILEASVQILVQEGAGGLSTRRVAERAGVSVGTLYQYFPNKEALLGALAERQAEAVVARCAQALRREEGRSTREAAREVVVALVEVYGGNLRLQAALAEQGAMRERLAVVRQAAERVEELLRFFLESQAERPRRPDLAAFLLSRAVQAAAWSAVVERPELAATEELVDELTELAVGYLRAG